MWRHGAPWHFGNYARRFRPWNLFVVYRRSPGILNRRSRRFSPSWRPRRSTMISSTITCAIKIPISRVSPLSHGRKSFTSAVIPLAFPTIFFLPPFYVFYRSCSISRNTFNTFYKSVLRVAHIRESLFRVQKILFAGNWGFSWFRPTGVIVSWTIVGRWLSRGIYLALIKREQLVNGSDWV